LIDELLALFGGRAQPVMTHLVESGKLTLHDVQVDTWGGFVWVNLDPDAKPLRDYLVKDASSLREFERGNGFRPFGLSEVTAKTGLPDIAICRAE
jgi:phenylpropionate dioxygenase-like ring-hydroxylating dioxygenase large terminal subunit